MSNTVLLKEIYDKQLKEVGYDRDLVRKKTIQNAKDVMSILGYEITEEEIIKFIDKEESITMEIASCIEGSKYQDPWLDTTDQVEEWPHWKRHEAYLKKEKNFGINTIHSLDKSTTNILGKLGDPNRVDGFDIRGLVMGYVQSGKTVNYTALINKAIDAGYKMIIVLAGMHDDLRMQTQVRLEEEVVGYMTKEKKATNKDKKYTIVNENEIGVGKQWYRSYDCKNITALTSRDVKGDFKDKDMTFHIQDHTTIVIVKKHRTVLEKLYKFLYELPVAEFTDENYNKKIIRDLPVLIIDDEADQASQNTSEETNPSAINRGIRKILNIFHKKSYVAYTATPFANILIDHNAYHEELGEDLFPKNFIVRLKKPSNYICAEKLFGEYDVNQKELNLIRYIDDEEVLIPEENRKDKEYEPIILNESLIKAIDSFILTITIRNLRGHKKKSNSMLVHATRFTEVQKGIKKLIEKYIENLKSNIVCEEEKEKYFSKLKELWDEDYEPTIEEMKGEHIDWIKIEDELDSTINSIKVKAINGKSEDALDYIKYKNGINVIAVGGDKLSRGLTLDGLSISYYLRASKTYDTLMQMGRWFGYREGYEDLCRIYTTETLVRWFKHVGVATEELMQEFDTLAELDARPEEFGLKVMSHPVMKVTNPKKMKAATEIKLNYHGKVVETTVINLDEEVLNNNYYCVEQLIKKVGGFSVAKEKSKNYLWNNIDSEKIIYFLKNYKTAKTATRANTQLLATYIKKQAERGNLNNWTIGIINNDSEYKKDNIKLICQKPIGLSKRSYRGNYDGDKLINIGKLVSENHEFLDLNDKQYKMLEKYEKKSDKICNKPKDNGLLLVYPIQIVSPRESSKNKKNENIESIISESLQTIIAIALVFPGHKDYIELNYSDNYIANSVFMEYCDYDEI